MSSNKSFRIEKDSMGEFNVPHDAYYGAQTMRAVENFHISTLRFPRNFIKAIALIKGAAAKVNCELGLINEEIASSIISAAQEVSDGKFDGQFVVDIFQTGSGTSTNMNANEVISNRAIEILGGTIGSKIPVHPNDHVNMGQSSNDVIPTAIHVSALLGIKTQLIPSLEILRNELIWHKPNCMPESVKDRFTNHYEKLLFFTKNPRYYFKQQFSIKKVLFREFFSFSFE